MNRIRELMIRKIDTATFVTTFVIWILLSFLAVFLGIGLLNSDALKATIEAQATILGFLGIIIIYALTSMDLQIDRLEQRRIEIEHEQIEAENCYRNLRIDVQNKKRYLVKQASIVGIMLVSSLLLSIGFLAVQPIYVTVAKTPSNFWFVATTFSYELTLLLFFEAIWFFFRIFRKIAD